MAKNGRVENLITFPERTEEERRKLAVKGGKASGMVRRERKRLQEALVAMLREKPKGSDRTTGEEILLNVIANLKETGDIASLEKLMKVLGQGEEEDDKKGSTTTIVINEVVARNGGQ